MRKKFQYLIWAILVVFVACDKGEEFGNQAPDTQFSIPSINLIGENRLNSIVSLSWGGNDPDGYVKGFELSNDGVQWSFTTSQDSTFKFSLEIGSDTSDIQLFVRSVDNENVADPTPDQLVIPIRNTPPTAEFGENLSIPDTAYLVTTTEWSATDIDGDETITNVYISLNGAAWYEVNKTKKIFSIVPVDPTANDTSNALIYYGTDAIPASQQIEGLILNDTNRLFIKSVDQAGTESVIDTSTTFYVKGKIHDLLVVGGVSSTSNPNPNQVYKDILTNINSDYDFIDMLIADGIYRPKIWNITFKLQLSFYDKLFFYSNQTALTNTYTGTSALLLESAANSLQDFANNGGKFFISTFFTYSTNIDGFTGVLPISGKSAKRTGDAFLKRDSGMVSNLASFPKLTSPDFLLTDIGVFNIDSSDTEVIYTAKINDGFAGQWNETKTIASGRRRNGKFNQVFFNIELWKMRQDLVALENLFDQILNVEFN